MHVQNERPLFLDTVFSALYTLTIKKQVLIKWTPAFALPSGLEAGTESGVTTLVTFYKSINVHQPFNRPP